jgi:hypothetical protein
MDMIIIKRGNHLNKFHIIIIIVFLLIMIRIKIVIGKQMIIIVMISNFMEVIKNAIMDIKITIIIIIINGTIHITTINFIITKKNGNNYY